MSVNRERVVKILHHQAWYCLHYNPGHYGKNKLYPLSVYHHQYASSSSETTVSAMLSLITIQYHTLAFSLSTHVHVCILYKRCTFWYNYERCVNMLVLFDILLLWDIYDSLLNNKIGLWFQTQLYITAKISASNIILTFLKSPHNR